MRSTEMRLSMIVFMLLVTPGIALGQLRADERLDTLGYELMTRVGVEPADCPPEVVAESRYSILFCGNLKKANREWVDEVRKIADALLLGSDPASQWAMAGDWEEREGWSRRHYFAHDAVVTVGVRRKPGFVFLHYPWQFPDCLEELPLPSGSAGERVAPRVAGEGPGPEPVYPELARVARLEAAVFLQGLITREGFVEGLCVQHVTRPGMGFEEAALEAVRHWRYEPATVGGEPVAVRYSITVEFKLH